MKLPEGLDVGGNILLSNTKIKALPNNLIVDGDLDLSNTPIKELPDNLTVKGNLSIEDSKFRTLPKGLVIGSYIDTRYTDIEEFPDDIIIGGTMHLDEFMDDDVIEEVKNHLLPELQAIDKKERKIPVVWKVDGKIKYFTRNGVFYDVDES